MSINRFFVLLFIGLATFGLVMLVKKPEVVKEFWLWVVGLASLIIRLGRLAWTVIKREIPKVWSWIKKEEERWVEVPAEKAIKSIKDKISQVNS